MGFIFGGVFILYVICNNRDTCLALDCFVQIDHCYDYEYLIRHQVSLRLYTLLIRYLHIGSYVIDNTHIYTHISEIKINSYLIAVEYEVYICILFPSDAREVENAMLVYTLSFCIVVLFSTHGMRQSDYFCDIEWRITCEKPKFIRKIANKYVLIQV